MKLPTKSLLAIAATLALVSGAGAQTVLVNQFGNTIAGDVTFARTFTNVTNGSAVTNGRVISWDQTAATLTGSGAPTMYGGARIFNSTAASWVGGTNRQSLVNLDPDRLRLGVDSATFTQAQGFMYIDKADFINGGSSGTWSLNDSAASLSTRITSTTNSAVRWLVRDGTQFYVSNTAFASNLGSTTTFNLTGVDLANTTWTAFNPVSGLSSTFSSAYDSYVAASDGTVATSSLNNITAFGLYFQSSGATGANWNNAFDQLSITAVPEPSSALLFGLGLAGLAVLRRRQKQA